MKKIPLVLFAVALSLAGCSQATSSTGSSAALPQSTADAIALAAYSEVVLGWDVQLSGLTTYTGTVTGTASLLGVSNLTFSNFVYTGSGSSATISITGAATITSSTSGTNVTSSNLSLVSSGTTYTLTNFNLSLSSSAVSGTYTLNGTNYTY